MFGAAEQGKVSIQDLLSTMSNTGTMLKGKTTIEDAAGSLEAFSNQAGNTAPAAIKVFQQLADAGFGDIQEQAKLTAMGSGNIADAIKKAGMGGAERDNGVVIEPAGIGEW